jgi:hypothetical protein
VHKVGIDPERLKAAECSPAKSIRIKDDISSNSYHKAMGGSTMYLMAFDPVRRVLLILLEDINKIEVKYDVSLNCTLVYLNPASRQ